ncbi:homeobox domain-containing protein [Pilobolus umbonatus]|nr:homeobox domain-containing protein [Pilobolus umbonatus]
MSETPPPSHSSDDLKKRTRVTPSQLSILEETFNMSATPDSKMRKQLAVKLQMPERSIQIWFQNRRAKVKMLQRRVVLRQEQESARARMCAEVTQPTYPYWFPTEPYSRPFAANVPSKMPIHRAWSSDMTTRHSSIPPPPSLFQNSYGSETPSISINGRSDMGDDIYGLTVSPSTTPQPYGVHRRLESEPLQSAPSHSTTGLITATSITVGSWHRMKISPHDLMCHFKMPERSFSWHIRDSNYHFKMMMPFDNIASIVLNVLEDNISAQIDMDLIEPPIFFMENTNGSWVQCSDFTEGMQASIVLRHIIRGLASDLRQELLSIVGADERLCQIARFPVDSLVNSIGSSIEPAVLMSHQNWRHQSLPPNPNWVQSTYPI